MSDCMIFALNINSGKNNKTTPSAYDVVNTLSREAFFMHKGRRYTCALMSIIIGLLIILSQILPEQFWWLMLAFALIGVGLWRIKCC